MAIPAKGVASRAGFAAAPAQPKGSGELLLETMERSLETVRRAFGASHRFYADALEHYARALYAIGDPMRADEATRRAAEIRTAALTPKVPSAAVPGDGAPVSRVLDAQGAARYLSLGLDTLYRLVRAGELPHSRVGKSIRFRPEDLDAYIAARVTREWTRVDKRGRPRRDGTKPPRET